MRIVRDSVHTTWTRFLARSADGEAKEVFSGLGAELELRFVARDVAQRPVVKEPVFTLELNPLPDDPGAPRTVAPERVIRPKPEDGEKHETWLVSHRLPPDVATVRVVYSWTLGQDPDATTTEEIHRVTDPFTLAREEPLTQHGAPHRIVVPRIPTFWGRTLVPEPEDPKKAWPLDARAQPNVDVELFPNRKLRLSWALSGASATVKLVGGGWERDVTVPPEQPDADDGLEGIEHRGAITIDPFEQPPDEQGRYRLVAFSFGGFSDEVVRVRGVVRLTLRQVDPPAKLRQRKRLHGGVGDGKVEQFDEVDEVEARAGTWREWRRRMVAEERKGVADANNVYKQTWLGQVPLDFSTFSFRWAAVRPPGWRLFLEVNEQKSAAARFLKGTQTLIDRVDPRNQALGMRILRLQDADGAGISALRPGTGLLEGSVAFEERHLGGSQMFEADLSVLEHEGATAVAAQLRMRYDRPLPGIVEFVACRAQGAAVVSVTSSSWDDLAFAWELAGDHAGHELRIHLAGETADGTGQHVATKIARERQLGEASPAASGRFVPRLEGVPELVGPIEATLAMIATNGDVYESATAHVEVPRPGGPATVLGPAFSGVAWRDYRPTTTSGPDKWREWEPRLADLDHPEQAAYEPVQDGWVYVYRHLAPAGPPGGPPGSELAKQAAFRCVAELRIDDAGGAEVLACRCPEGGEHPSCPVHTMEPSLRGEVVRTPQALNEAFPRRIDERRALYLFLVSRIPLVTASIKELEGAGMLAAYGLHVLVRELPADANDPRLIEGRYLEFMDPLAPARRKAAGYREWKAAALEHASALRAAQDGAQSGAVDPNRSVEVKRLLLASLLAEIEGDEFRDRMRITPEQYLHQFEQELEWREERAKGWLRDTIMWLDGPLVEFVVRSYHDALAQAARPEEEVELVADFVGWFGAVTPRMGEDALGRLFLSRLVQTSALFAQQVGDGVAPKGLFEQVAKRAFDELVLRDSEAPIETFKKSSGIAAQVVSIWCEVTPVFVHMAQQRKLTTTQQHLEAVVASLQHISRSDQPLIVQAFSNPVTFASDGDYVTHTIEAIRVDEELPPDLKDWLAKNATQKEELALFANLKVALAGLNLLIAIHAVKEANDGLDVFKESLGLIGAAYSSVEAFGGIVSRAKVPETAGKAIGAVMAVVELVGSSIDFYKEAKQADYDAMVAKGLVVVAAGLVVAAKVIALVGGFSQLTVVGFPLGVALEVVGAALAIVGSIIYAFADDTDMETFARYCFLGEDSGEAPEVTDSPAWTKVGAKKRGIPDWRDEADPGAALDNQISALFNLLAAFEVASDRSREVFIFPRLVLPGSSFAVFWKDAPHDDAPIRTETVIVKMRRAPLTPDDSRELEVESDVSVDARWFPPHWGGGRHAVRIQRLPLGAAMEDESVEMRFVLASDGGNDRLIPARGTLVKTVVPIGVIDGVLKGFVKSTAF